MLAAEGEAYRERLVARVKALGMTKHVRFVDRFVGRVELTRWLQAADVFVTPYPNLDQTVSGTLSYAMGAGRAVVSTPYAYAAELLADGRGVLVPPGSPAAFAAALNELLGDDARRTRWAAARTTTAARWPGRRSVPSTTPCSGVSARRAPVASADPSVGSDLGLSGRSRHPVRPTDGRVARIRRVCPMMVAEVFPWRRWPLS